MLLVCLEGCVNVNTHVQGKQNDPRIHNGKGKNNIMRSGNVRENVYLKQVVI